VPIFVHEVFGPEMPVSLQAKKVRGVRAMTALRDSVT